MRIFLILLTGLAAGTLSGLIGVGGGVVIIPALVILLGFSQHTAQGTTLAAMIPPIGLLAAYVYYKADAVDIPAAALIGLGFIIGGFFGAKLAVHIPADVLKRVFGVMLLVISTEMIFGK